CQPGADPGGHAVRARLPGRRRWAVRRRRILCGAVGPERGGDVDLTLGCAALRAGLAVLVSGAEPAARHRLRHVVRRMVGDRGRTDPRRAQVRWDGRCGLDAVWSRRMTALGCGVVAFLVVVGAAGWFVGPVPAVVADRLLA